MHKGWLVVAAGLVAGTSLVAPRMKMTPIYTVQGHVNRDGPVMTRDRRRMYYVQDATELVMYDRTAKKETRLLGQMLSQNSGLVISLKGDRLAFSRDAEDGSGPFIWTLSLDPATGLATGAPKRVSMSVAGEPAFSADGRLLAFDAGPRGAPGHKLVVVAANGGPERVVATTGAESLWPIQWAPDGQAIYFGGAYEKDDEYTKNGIYRVPLAGGTPSVVVRTSDYGTTPGVSPDGRWIIVSDPSDDSTTVATGDGKRLVTYFPEEGEFADSWFDNTHGLASINHLPRTSMVMALSGGAAHPVSDSMMETGNPAWSPDGHLVATASRRAPGIAIANADGTGQRLLKTAETPSIAAGVALQWSPDGKYLAYRPTNLGLRVYDLATGADRLIAPAVAAPRIAWRSDSKALLFVTTAPPARTDSIWPATVHERTLAGSDQVLAKVDLFCPRLCAVDIVQDSVLFTLNRNLEYQIRNLKHMGSPVTVFKRPTFAQGAPAYTSNFQWMAIRTANATGEMRQIDVMHIDGSGRHTVKLSFETTAGQHNPWISPDGRRLIVMGHAPGESTMSFYDVDVASGAIRKLTSLPRSSYGQLPNEEVSISPDGRLVTYTMPRAPSVTFYEVDFSDLLKTATGGRGGDR